MTGLNTHWNAIYEHKSEQKLGWYEEDLSQSFKFIQLIPDYKKATIFIAGAGTSTLVDRLHEQGNTLILNDISDTALNKLQNRLAEACTFKWHEYKHQWLCYDISQDLPNNTATVDVWIDRAVLHFLLTEEAIQGYFKNVQKIVKQGGFVLLAEFSIMGAKQCAGLEVHRYSLTEMQQRLGDSFTLIDAEDYNYINPFGDKRPYLYALFQKK